MSPTIQSNNSTPPPTDSGSAASAATATASVGETMFLQLLVAQIKNQDPLNPADGTQFLAQLAQFSQLEQSINMSTDLGEIKADLDQIVAQTHSRTNQ